MKGVLDRFEDNNKAVILIEEQHDEWIVPIEELPQGSQVNTWFTLKKTGNQYHILSIDKDTTEKQKENASDLMNKLRARKKRWD